MFVKEDLGVSSSLERQRRKGEGERGREEEREGESINRGKREVNKETSGTKRRKEGERG